MLSKLKILYPSVQDGILDVLLEQARRYAMDYCGLDSYDSSLDGTVLRMCQEDINALYAEGFTGESAEGSSVTYSPDYTERVYRALNRKKRIRTV